VLFASLNNRGFLVMCSRTSDLSITGVRGYRLDFADPVGRICRAIPVEGIGWFCVAEIKSRVLPSQLLVNRQGLQELFLV
jgi:hypothetical protein